MSRTLRELYANSTQQDEIDALREQLRDGIDVIVFLTLVVDDYSQHQHIGEVAAQKCSTAMEWSKTYLDKLGVKNDTLSP